MRRVRGWNQGSDVGHVAIISRMEDISYYDNDGPWLYFEDGTEGYATSFELVPVAEATGTDAGEQAAALKFKVGDRVRLVKDGFSTAGAVGKMATIDSWSGTMIDDGDYLLRIDGPVDYKTCAISPEYTRAKPDCFVLADEPTLTIQAGRYYRTRDGRKVGPVKQNELTQHLFGAPQEGISHNAQWYGNGRALSYGEHESDLIVEWVDEPKIKIGDRVRVTRLGDEPEGSHHGAQIGEVFIITDVYNDEYLTDPWFFYRHEIEPVATRPANDNSTAGFTVPLFDSRESDFGEYRAGFIKEEDKPFVYEDGKLKVRAAGIKQEEPDATLRIKFVADASALDAEIDRVKRRLKKLAKKARELGISLEYDAA